MEITKELDDTARAIEDKVRPQVDEAKRRLGELNEEVMRYIKRNPGKSLLGALAIGYVIGRIARR